jgi:hypothetical protein
MKKILPYFLLFVLATFASCIDKPTYPSTPVIAYKNFIRYGNPSNPDSVELEVSFTDNEGDIGLDQTDTSGIFSKGNIYMDYMYWDTVGTGPDHWSYYDTSPADSIPFDTLKIAYRVPPVLPEGDPAEPMKGLIFVKQKAPVNIFPKIMYVVYLYDKQYHRSDTIHSPPIYF